MDCRTDLAPEEHALYAALSAKLSRAVPDRSNVTLTRAAEAMQVAYADAKIALEGLVDSGFASQDDDGHVTLHAGVCVCSSRASHAGTPGQEQATNKPSASRREESVPHSPSGSSAGRASASQDATAVSQGDLAEIVKRVHRPGSAGSRRRDERPRRKRADNRPADPAAWHAAHLADYFGEEVNVARHFGFGAGETNFQALGKSIADWRREGTPSEVIKAMIDLFAQDTTYMSRERPAWRQFLGQRHKLLVKVERATKAEAAEAHRDDPDYWVGKSDDSDRTMDRSLFGR